MKASQAGREPSHCREGNFMPIFEMTDMEFLGQNGHPPKARTTAAAEMPNNLNNLLNINGIKIEKASIRKILDLSRRCLDFFFAVLKKNRATFRRFRSG
jgi:hypothetical protein